jgi:hypothetical protein
MNNPEKLATYSTQDTGQINVREHRRGNQMNKPKKLEKKRTKDTRKINVREQRRGNQNKQSRETGDI